MKTIQLPDRDEFPIAWACLACARGIIPYDEAFRWLTRRGGLDKRMADGCLKAARQTAKPGYGEASVDPMTMNHAPPIRRRLQAPFLGRMLQT